MFNHRRHGTSRLFPIVLVSVGIAVLLASCSSSPASSDSAGPSQAATGTSTSPGNASSAAQKAQAELQKYSGTAALTSPGPAFSASKAKGKTVMLAAYDASNPALAEADGTFISALRHAGVKTVLCDGKSTPTGDSACFSQAFAQRMAAIEAQGSSPKTYATAISKANSLKIPILEGADFDPNVTVLPQGLAANAGSPWSLVGQLMADWVVADSHGDAHVLYLTIPDVDGAGQEEHQFQATLNQLCPKCTITVKGIVVADWSSNVGPATSSALLANPSINYVVPGFDPMINFAGPAIQQVGRASSVKVVTSGGSYQEMQQLKNHQLVYCDVGIDYPALGLLEANQVLRAITNGPQVKAAAPPVKIFTRSNIGSVDVTQANAQSGAYYTSPATYEAEFYKAWSLPGSG